MSRLPVGLIQLCGGADPAANLAEAEALIRQAAAGGAALILTPENTNLVTADRALQKRVLVPEAEDRTLARLRAVAAELERWLLIGSLGLAGAAQGRFFNRSFLIGPDGVVRARYDKIHMFDVDVSARVRFRESAVIQPGARAVCAATPWGGLGLTICYDLRFPALFAALARAGAGIITVPAAFTRPTGAAHWEVLLRARAIETGSFILAPAQTGAHAGGERESWGHSLAVSPWGDVLADGGEAVGVVMASLDLDAVAQARRRVPALRSAAVFEPPAP